MPLPLFKEDKQKPKATKTQCIAIAAGKGGVGKSTVAVNLARALKMMGFKVGLIDADVYGPSVRKMLPEDRMPTQKGRKLEPAIGEGIPFISMAHFRKERDAVIARAPIANGIIGQFLNDVLWGDLDYLLIDFPPGTGDIQLTLAQKGHLRGAVLVTTPQEVALLDVKKTLEMFTQLQIPILGIIENLCGYHHAETDTILYLFGNGGGERLAREVGVPLLGKLPIDPELCLRSDQGLSPFMNKKESSCPSGEHFFQIARRLHEEIHEAKPSSQALYAVDKIFQKDRSTFSIKWQDGATIDYTLNNLQKQCPCAGCASKDVSIDPDVSATSVQRVGNYALQITFTNGCSKGVYSFEFLRKLGSL